MRSDRVITCRVGVRLEGCTQANPSLTHCEEERGLILNPNTSSSWSTERLDNDGLFELNTYYGAFDLEGSAPFIDPPSKYFPLKRADRPEQYTLGRVFLHGAYVVADYERQSFSVSQALFPDASKESNSSMVGMTPLGAEQKPALGKAAIAGVAVGLGLRLLLTVAVLLW